MLVYYVGFLVDVMFHVEHICRSLGIPRYLRGVSGDFGAISRETEDLRLF